LAQYKDLEDMIEILSVAIVGQETEEQFFRRSAEASSSAVAKALFLEIAEEFVGYRRNLEARKQKLEGALEDLKRAEQRVGGERAGQGEVTMEPDPVCGMRCDKEKTQYISAYKGKMYYFCSDDCKKAFDIAPEKYVKE